MLASPPATTAPPLPESEAEDIYGALLEAYRTTGPVEVDFRALVPNVARAERATHAMHPYPAKVLRHIPALFAAAPQLSGAGGQLLDPFCGSGTVLVEAQLAGRMATGLDTNPLARLAASVKTTPLESGGLLRSLDGVLSSAGPSRPLGQAAARRLKYWFHPHALREIEMLRSAIEHINETAVRSFLELSLSATARAVSLADPRIAVPVRLRSDQYEAGHRLRDSTVRRLSMLRHTEARAVFATIARDNIRRVASLSTELPPARVLDGDARDLAASLTAESVDCVITSPPYLGAQKYIRACSLSLLALGLGEDGDLRPLIARSVGREHFRKSEVAQGLSSGVPAADEIVERCRETNPLRAHLAAVYLREMREALVGIAVALRPGGHLVLVAGPNQLVGEAFATPNYLTTIAVEQGLVVKLVVLDTIRSRGLMTRRNRSASVISHETVTVLSKPGQHD